MFMRPTVFLIISAALLVVAASYMLTPAAGIGQGTTISAPVTVDGVGSPIIDHINVNQKFYISATISNDADTDQDFVYIVQISDEQDTVVLLKWLGGKVDPGQLLNIAVSWVPTTPGTYTVEVFLWDGIHTQNALDNSKTLTIPIS